MQLQYDKKGPAGLITLSNPPFNSLTHPVFARQDELIDFLADPQLKYVIIRGTGKHFCSGADVDSLVALTADRQKFQLAIKQGKALLNIIRAATIPVAALIVGSCLGGGLEIALACHFRFAAKNAMFGFPESDHGLMPGLGGTVTGHQLIGPGRLIDLILTGRLVRSEEALEMGLIDMVAPVKHIEETVITYLEHLTSRHSQELIRSIMEAIRNSSQLPTQEALAEETKLFCRLAQRGINDDPTSVKGH